MTVNPVMQALVRARLQEFDSRDAEIAAAVAAKLGPSPELEPSTPVVFKTWCETLGVPWLPARPNTVALFVLEGAKLGIEQMLECIHSISVSHRAAQLADPTSGFPVTSALNTITKIEPPRSWVEAEKQKFIDMPYGLQRYVLKREDQRDAALRRSQKSTRRREEAIEER